MRVATFYDLPGNSQKGGSPTEPVPQFGNNGSTVRYGERQWKIIKQMRATFDTNAGFSNVVLLESLEPTGMGGAGQPLNDVELLIVQGGRAIYDFVEEAARLPEIKGTRFYMDDYLETKDLKRDGIPQILFHSSSQGASDFIKVEHILLYDRPKATFTDIAPKMFYNSGTHGLDWLTLGDRTFIVIADRNWRAGVPLELRCHYCASPFEYDAYQWSGKTGSFVVYRRLYGKKEYSSADEAIKGDWEFIRSGLK